MWRDKPLDFVATDISLLVEQVNFFRIRQRLRFRDRPLKEIMDFISRWYDVDVVYEDESVKNYLFGCNFNRHVTVTPLLELFQSTGTVRFEVVGKKIIVKK